MEHIEFAIKLDPLNPLFKGFYCLNLFIARRFDEAVSAAHEALRIDPSSLVAQGNLAPILVVMGKYKEGVENYKLSYTLLGINEAVDALDSGFAKGGYIGALNKAAEALVERTKTTYVSPFFIAELYSLTKNKESTMEWIDRAFKEHDPNLIYLLQPTYDILRDDPRFQGIAKKMNLPYK
jgi:tetratricopeptide (TPR) repeat protein